MTLKDLINSINGNYSIIITKKDGHFSDESAIVSRKDDFKKWCAERKKAREIAEREDLVLDMIVTEEGRDLLISLKEI